VPFLSPDISMVWLGCITLQLMGALARNSLEETY
jgi:hypothetical protein